ncbi:hypothetical protein DFH09DRAFT_1075303 [Mycena vulgaris]|nr:hypothetical protein DFH09DRAFT_1075303 [Mycena vulgaris]
MSGSPFASPIGSRSSPDVHAWTKNADMIFDLGGYYRYPEYLVTPDGSKFHPLAGADDPRCFLYSLGHSVVLEVSLHLSESTFSSTDHKWDYTRMKFVKRAALPTLPAPDSVHRGLNYPAPICALVPDASAPLDVDESVPQSPVPHTGGPRMSPLHRMFGALAIGGTMTNPAATMPVPKGGDSGLQ